MAKLGNAMFEEDFVMLKKAVRPHVGWVVTAGLGRCVLTMPPFVPCQSVTRPAPGLPGLVVSQGNATSLVSTKELRDILRNPEQTGS